LKRSKSGEGNNLTQLQAIAKNLNIPISSKSKLRRFQLIAQQLNPDVVVREVRMNRAISQKSIDNLDSLSSSITYSLSSNPSLISTLSEPFTYIFLLKN
jgi:hypothetical protein